MISRFARPFVFSCADARRCGVRRRERQWEFSAPQGKRRSGLGGPGGDAAWVTRCGGACQAGEARALAAAARCLAAQPQVWAAGHADAIATLMRRALTRTRAPIFSSFRRMVPQVALANGVWCRAMRRKAHSNRADTP